MLAGNSINHVSSEEPFISREVYKNEKRKIRTRLFLLVLYHMIMIFIFVGLACVQYLLRQQTELAIMSDILFFVYSLMVMLIFKYKNRKLLYTSMFILLLLIGTRIAVTVLQILEDTKVEIVSLALMIVAVANCIVPWTLIVLWNRLKDSKWRQTFDFFQKIYSRPMIIK